MSLGLPGISDLAGWDELMGRLGMVASLRDWVDKALCGSKPIDDFKWFPSKEATGQGKASNLSPRVQGALALCSQCPVQRECLTYALETDSEWGIWGGTFGWERQAAMVDEGDVTKAADLLLEVSGKRTKRWGWDRLYERRSA